MSQTVDHLIRKLDSAGLVTSYEKQRFLKERKSIEDHLNKMDDDESAVVDWENAIKGEPHYPLAILLQLKMHSTAGIRSAGMFSPSPVKINKGEEKQVILHLEHYAKKISSAKLISDKTMEELLTAIRKLELKSEYEVTAFVREKTEKEYFLTPGKIGKFVKQLLSKELISETDHDEIMKKSEAGDFRNYTEVLRYLKDLVIIDLDEYSGKPENYLEKLYRKTSTACTGLDFDALQFSIVPDKRASSPGFSVYNMKVTLKKNGNTYSFTSFFDAAYKNKSKETISRIPENYYAIFNKILADRESPYRLHELRFTENSFGIIAMTKNQFKDLQWSYTGMTGGGYIDLSYENFTNKLTQTKIRDAINLYDSIGLLSHLSQAEKYSCIQEIEVKDINYYSDILSSFKNVVFEIDLEYGVDDGQYRELTKQIAAISKRNFLPADIIDTYNYKKRKKFDYGFTLNGRKYSTALQQEDDWLDTGFWDLIETAVSEQDKAGKFYYIHPADGMRQIYLTHEQHKILTEKKMIELEESDLEK